MSCVICIKSERFFRRVAVFDQLRIALKTAVGKLSQLCERLLEVYNRGRSPRSEFGPALSTQSLDDITVIPRTPTCKN